MKYTVELTYQAEAEANLAYEWILKESPTNAYNWFDGFVDAVESLQTLPERCPIAPEAEEIGQEIRHLLYGKFRLLFSIEAHAVIILHLRHGAQKHLDKDSF